MPDTQTLSITNCSRLILSFRFPPRYCSWDYSDCLRSFKDFSEAWQWINTKPAKSDIIGHPFSDFYTPYFPTSTLITKSWNTEGWHLHLAVLCEVVLIQSLMYLVGILCRPSKCLVRPDFDLLGPLSISFVHSWKKNKIIYSRSFAFRYTRLTAWRVGLSGGYTIRILSILTLNRLFLLSSLM